jgi:hypothetical protein
MTVYATAQKRMERIAICKVCVHRKPVQWGQLELYACNKCSCSPLKPFYEGSICPIGKW